MHTRLLPAALAAVVALMPVRLEAHSASPRRPTGQEQAPDPARRLLAHRTELRLSPAQVEELANLSNRLEQDRGHLQIAGFDRVPGKSVPRFVRVHTTGAAAVAIALRRLTADQRPMAERLLAGQELARTAPR